jgi:hypothetical protein
VLKVFSPLVVALIVARAIRADSNRSISGLKSIGSYSPSTIYKSFTAFFLPYEEALISVKKIFAAGNTSD